MMPIKSVCPKCGLEGIQNIHETGRDRATRHRKYLYMRHDGGKECYIGRVRSTEEALGDLNKPETMRDFEPIIQEISDFAKSAESKYMIRGPTVGRELRGILQKYGLWN